MKYGPLRKKLFLSGKRFGETNENLYFDTRALRLIYSFVEKILGNGGYLLRRLNINAERYQDNRILTDLNRR